MIEFDIAIISVVTGLLLMSIFKDRTNQVNVCVREPISEVPPPTPLRRSPRFNQHLTERNTSPVRDVVCSDKENIK